MAPTVPAAFTEELTLGHGIAVGHGCIEMLMRAAGVKGLPGNKRARSKHQTPTASDLVDRKFTRDEPNKLWVPDITEHPTREGKYIALLSWIRFRGESSGGLSTARRQRHW